MCNQTGLHCVYLTWYATYYSIYKKKKKPDCACGPGVFQWEGWWLQSVCLWTLWVGSHLRCILKYVTWGTAWKWKRQVIQHSVILTLPSPGWRPPLQPALNKDLSEFLQQDTIQLQYKQLYLSHLGQFIWRQNTVTNKQINNVINRKKSILKKHQLAKCWIKSMHYIYK